MVFPYINTNPPQPLKNSLMTHNLGMTDAQAKSLLSVYTKKGQCGFFPNDWSQQRVKEEVAYAYMIKPQMPTGNKYESTLFDGTTLVFYVDLSTKKIKSYFPSF